MKVDHPLQAAIMPSNRAQEQRAYDMFSSNEKRKIGLLGLSFKAGTDDLRESPLVELAEMLIGKGYELRIFDSNVEYARVFGANKEYIESKIPHVSSLLCKELDEVVAASDVLIIGNGDARFAEVLQNAGDDKQILDLVGFMAHTSSATKEGICW